MVKNWPASWRIRLHFPQCSSPAVSIQQVSVLGSLLAEMVVRSCMPRRTFAQVSLAVNLAVGKLPSCASAKGARIKLLQGVAPSTTRTPPFGGCLRFPVPPLEGAASSKTYSRHDHMTSQTETIYNQTRGRNTLQSLRCQVLSGREIGGTSFLS